MGRARLIVGALGLGLALIGLPAAGSAAPGSALPGTAVVATAAAGRSPVLGTGRYVTRLAADTTYLRLRRTAPGTTLHVGAQMVGRGGSVGEGLDVEIATSPARGSCGSAVVFRPTLGESAPVLYAATSTWTAAADHPCTADRTLYLAIHAPTDPQDVGRQVQIRVYEEPPVDDSSFSLLTTPSPQVWSELEPGVAQPIAPGHVVDEAPQVTDGTYAVTIRPGEDDFLAVPVQWGDTVRVQLDTELPAAVDPADPGLGLHLLGPLLDNADTGSLGTDPDIGPTRDRRAYRTGSMSEVISYINRDSVDATVSGADLAGMHYVALTYLPVVPGAGPLGVRLTVQVRPGGSAAPLYTDVAGVPAPQADSRLVDGSLKDLPRSASPGPAQPSVGEDRSFPWLSLGLAVGGLIVAGGLFDLAIHLRRRRRGRHRGRHR